MWECITDSDWTEEPSRRYIRKVAIYFILFWHYYSGNAGDKLAGIITMVNGGKEHSAIHAEYGWFAKVLQANLYIIIASGPEGAMLLERLCIYKDFI